MNLNLNNIQKRFLLFLFGCITARLFIVYLVKNVGTKYLPFLGIFGLAISAGLFYYFFSGTRKTGPETFHTEIWWNKLRPIHATLYLLFAISAFCSYEKSWIFLLIDVIIGLIAFLLYHYRNGDFSKL